MNTAKNEVIHDMTQGNVAKQLIVFAFPLFLSGLFQIAYNMVDMVVVGQFVGKNGISAVSVGGEVMNFILFVGMGFSNAGQIILSQYVGANKKEKIGKMISVLFIVILSCGLALSIICFLLRSRIIGWMNTPDYIVDDALAYLNVCCFGLVFTYGYNLVSAILRGLGDSKNPFIFIAAASVINIILDLVFIAGFHMGVFGAALATVIGQTFSFLWAMYFLYKRRDEIGFSFRIGDFRISKEELVSLIKLGIPMTLQGASVTFSKLVISAWINPFGSVVIAVTAIGNKIVSITNVFSLAFSTAGGSVIAQNIGAEKYHRVPKVIGICMVMDTILGVVFAAVTCLFPQAVFGLFTSDADVLEAASEFLLPAIILYIGCAIRPPMSALINGSGNTRLNFAVAVIDGIIVRISAAYLMGFVLEMGYKGCWYGNGIASTMPFFIGGAYFLSGKWKTRKYLIKD